MLPKDVFRPFDLHLGFAAYVLSVYLFNLLLTFSIFLCLSFYIYYINWNKKNVAVCGEDKIIFGVKRE